MTSDKQSAVKELQTVVYYATNDEYDAELLKWWNWK